MGATGALTFTALHPDLVGGVVALNGLADHVAYTNFQEAIAAPFGGTKAEVADEYRKRSAVTLSASPCPLPSQPEAKDASVPPDSVLKLARVALARNPFVLIDHQPERGHATDYAGLARRLPLRHRRPRLQSLEPFAHAQRPPPAAQAHATAAGVWFYAEAEGIREKREVQERTLNAQVLLSGHGTVPESWRLTAVLDAGDTLRIGLTPRCQTSGSARGRLTEG